MTDVLREEGISSIVFCQLAQGLLTDKYLKEIPADSRASSVHSPFLEEKGVQQSLSKIQALQQIAQERGQSLAQMALAWVLRDPVVTSALIGASRPQQIVDNVAALDAAPFTDEELKAINSACGIPAQL